MDSVAKNRLDFRRSLGRVLFCPEKSFFRGGGGFISRTTAGRLVVEPEKKKHRKMRDWLVAQIISQEKRAMRKKHDTEKHSIERVRVFFFFFAKFKYPALT